jgi:hypothetical protein
MITAFTIIFMKIVCGKKMPVSFFIELYKYKNMFYIPFFLFGDLRCNHFFHKKTLLVLCEVIFGTLCAYLLFPNIIKNNILNLTVDNS